MLRYAIHAAIAIALSGAAIAQPSRAPDQARRALSSYVYMIDAAGNKVLVSTKFWRNALDYDDRAFHRYLDVLARLEKRGFRLDENATIETWDGSKPFARCFIYMEEPQSGRTSRKGVTTGSRIGCTEAGVSEQVIRNSDNPKHVEQLMQRFGRFLALAKQNIGK